MSIIGYARTSTTEQDYGLDAQEAELKRFGVDQLFSEQVSSVAKELPELEKALAACKKGDVFVVTKPDRLARNTVKLLTTVDTLVERGVDVVILSFNNGEPLDTRSPMAKAMFGMLAVFAELERSMMLQRQRDAAAVAKAKGEFYGYRPPSEHLPMVQKLSARGLLQREIAAELKLTERTVNRILNPTPKALANRAAWEKSKNSSRPATGSELARVA